LRFTQVSDGNGGAASYDVRYAAGTITFASAPSVTRGSCASPLAGTSAGSLMTCVVYGLTQSTVYNFQAMSFRGTSIVNAALGGVSNIASGTTHQPILNYFPDSDVGDLGPSATDLQALLEGLGAPVLASIGNTVDATSFASVPDPRLSIGIGTPFQFGSVYLNWNGSPMATLRVNGHQFAVFDFQQQLYQSALNLPDSLFVVSEPASCVLATLSVSGFLFSARCRRHHNFGNLAREQPW
jgi:hypothetical protein